MHAIPYRHMHLLIAMHILFSIRFIACFAARMHIDRFAFQLGLTIYECHIEILWNADDDHNQRLFIDVNWIK